MKSTQHSKAIDAFRKELEKFIEVEKENKKAGRKESSTSRVSFDEEELKRLDEESKQRRKLRKVSGSTIQFDEMGKEMEESETDDLSANKERLGDDSKASLLQLSSVSKLTETKTKIQKKGVVMV